MRARSPRCSPTPTTVDALVPQDGGQGLPRRARTWRARSTCCAPTTSCSATWSTAGCSASRRRRSTSWPGTPTAPTCPARRTATSCGRCTWRTRSPATRTWRWGSDSMVSEIATDSYIVAAVDDHIVPWPVSYRTTQLFKGPMRFVLTSAGHIAGIVNPPAPKARLWTNDDLPPSTPTPGCAAATEHRETWWNDWAAGSTPAAARASRRRRWAPTAHPVLGDAPGDVRQRRRSDRRLESRRQAPAVRLPARSCGTPRAGPASARR